jgi:hypothetical protein
MSSPLPGIRALSKTMDAPFGDQDGDRPLASARDRDPSPFMTWMRPSAAYTILDADS